MQFVQQLWIQGVEAFVMSIAVYISWWSRVDIVRDQRTMRNDVDTMIYDFIVGDPFPIANIPGFSIGLLNFPEIDWMHHTVPQATSCGACVNHESGWSQGKGLGGTSNTNFLIHSRGHPKDFDQWANITGDSRWDYESVLPFFKRSEDYFGEKWRENEDVHGKGGPLRIETVGVKYGGDLFVRAAQELGYANVDVNGRFSEGFDLITYPIKRGIRQGTYNAYIRPILKKKSLTIRKYAHVTKILFKDQMNGEKPVAHGVEYRRHNKKFKIFASKEVIISAGIQSSKILMLSGIGPKSHLESLGIDVKVDSPQVGRNLQDHISTYLGPFMVNRGSPVVILERDFTPPSALEYIKHGTGILAQSGSQAIGFISTTQNSTGGFSTQGNLDVWPDIQFLYLGAHLYTHAGRDFSRAFHIREDIMREYSRRISHGQKNAESFSIITSLSRPHQTGEILLKSKDPFDDLSIDPKYFQDERDLNILVEGVKKAVEIVETTDTFRSIGAKFTDQPFPGCESIQFRSDDYWKCFIKQFSITLHHIVGTCAMGTKDVNEAVIDSELRVNGVENLRVIDASAMPRVPIGNTNAPTIMVGERGSEFILEKWR